MRPFSEMGESELAAALAALRPEPSPAFAAELDERVAAGFPRRTRGSAGTLFAGLRGRNPRKLVLSTGFAAIVVIVAITVVIAASGGNPSGDPEVIDGTLSAPPERGPAALQAAPGVRGGNESAGAAKQAAPEVEAEAAESAGEAIGAPAVPSSGRTAASLPHRDVERGAQIVIGTKPGEVGEASSQVFEIVHADRGVVLDSSTQNGSGTQAEASFELLIPSGKVDDAMAAFSRIGEVVNRHETTNDITAPTVGASERLQDSEARIEGLLAQLAESTSDLEREVVEAELGSERHHAAHLKSKLAGLKQRANLSRVSVRIVGGRGALSPGGGSWGVGDALHDAGHLLAIAAGVAILALAVLSPLALILLLVWLAGRAWARRARERALT